MTGNKIISLAEEYFEITRDIEKYYNKKWDNNKKLYNNSAEKKLFEILDKESDEYFRPWINLTEGNEINELVEVFRKQNDDMKKYLNAFDGFLDITLENIDEIDEDTMFNQNLSQKEINDIINRKIKDEEILNIKKKIDHFDNRFETIILKKNNKDKDELSL